MIVKATKVFAKELNKALKGHGNIERLEYVEMDEYNWHLLTGGNWYNNGEDYNERTGNYKAIKVIYDAECYASNVYLLTEDLRCNYANNDTLETYTDRLANALAI